MKRLISILAHLSLVLVSVAGIAAWILLPRHMRVTFESEPSVLARQLDAISFAELLKRAKPNSNSLGTRTRYLLLEDDCRVGFDGSSNLHDFQGVTSAVSGEIEMSPSSPADQPTAWINADARSLDTGNSSRDKDMHADYLQSKDHPDIEFKLEGVSEIIEETEHAFRAVASGTFTCHGKSIPVQVPIAVEREGTYGLIVRGEWNMKMTDVGIDPPRALGGLVRCKDAVKCWFVLQARGATQ